MNPLTYYQSKLTIAKEYLASRRIPFMIADSLGFGCCDRSYPSILPDINSKEGKEIRKKYHDQGYLKDNGHEVFRGSLVVPIYNLNGELENLYGRKISNRLRSGVSKHTYFFNKQNGLFNFKTILKHKAIVLTGGVFESLSFISQGFDNTIACFGINNFHENHLKLLVKYHVNHVYIALNNKSETQIRIVELANSMVENSIAVSLVALPSKYMDFNEFHKADGKLSDLIDSAQSIGSKTKKKIDVNDISYEFEDRQYRIRGLQNSLAKGSLKINMMVQRLELFHTDIFDLYVARLRKKFINDASEELLIPNEDIKKDIGNILFDLEGVQDDLINKILSPVNKMVEFSEYEKTIAVDYLKDKNLLSNIVRDFKTCGMVGQERNALLGYICATSRLMSDPISLIIQSESSCGKSTLQNAIESFIPAHQKMKMSKISSQALYYLTDSLAHKSLILEEDQGSNSSVYELKLLLSEKQLTITTVVKDTTGKLVSESFVVEGPVQLLMTTTQSEIPEELANRCLVLSVQGKKGDTKIIHEKQRKSRTLDGLINISIEKEAIIKKHHCMQMILKPVKVVIPFAEQLTFVDTRARNRRDHDKYLNLLSAVTFLHQFQREKKSITVDGQTLEYVEATNEDLRIANELVKDVLAQSINELAPQTKEFLLMLNHFKDSEFTRKMIRDYSNISNTRINVHLKRLVDLELVMPLRGSKGQLYEYKLLEYGEIDSELSIKESATINQNQ